MSQRNGIPGITWARYTTRPPWRLSTIPRRPVESDRKEKGSRRVTRKKWARMTDTILRLLFSRPRVSLKILARWVNRWLVVVSLVEEKRNDRRAALVTWSSATSGLTTTWDKTMGLSQTPIWKMLTNCTRCCILRKRKGKSWKLIIKILSSTYSCPRFKNPSIVPKRLAGLKVKKISLRR